MQRFQPRVKTYSAISGFVYQYKFSGHEAGRDGDRYRFETTQDRQQHFVVTVRLPTDAIAQWESSEARTLNPTERYALAKMALFAALDNAVSPEQIPQPVCVDAVQIRHIAATLDL